MAAKTSVDRFTILIILQIVFITFLLYNQVIQSSQSIYISAAGVISQENQASSQEEQIFLEKWKNHREEILKRLEKELESLVEVEHKIEESFSVVENLVQQYTNALELNSISKSKEREEEQKNQYHFSKDTKLRIYKGHFSALEYGGKCIFANKSGKQLEMARCKTLFRKQAFFLRDKTLRMVEYNGKKCLTVTEENEEQIILFEECDNRETQQIDLIENGSKIKFLWMKDNQCLSTDLYVLKIESCESAIIWKNRLLAMPKVTVITPIGPERCAFARNVYSNFARQVYEYDLKELVVLDSGACDEFLDIAKLDKRVIYERLLPVEKCRNDTQEFLDYYQKFQDLSDEFRRFEFDIWSQELCEKRWTGYVRDLATKLGNGEIFVNFDSDDCYHHNYINMAVKMFHKWPDLRILQFSGQTRVTILPGPDDEEHQLKHKQPYIYQFEDRVQSPKTGCGQAYRRISHCSAKRYKGIDTTPCCDYPKNYGINEDFEFARCIPRMFKKYENTTIILREPFYRIKINWGGNVFRKVYNKNNFTTDITGDYVNEIVHFLDVASFLMGNVLHTDRPQRNDYTEIENLGLDSILPREKNFGE